ncbi:NADP-dependent oxidoreductase [Aquirhabdus parva]|uniref:NADP-dependent oxidoreductase n=1 Tax=Aquirhabdus parva TaxID=2283318 RepID=A0A345P9N5_9GAMM|nr:NADP-dependent oxidoreductase [Aquirhabdus parva]AXI03994.1 NADP-dependent oxidoreductase [Aquirhabdus parva]
MKAFIIDRYGKSAVGRISETPAPIVGAYDVLVKIHATSINPLDLKIREGAFKLILPYRLPLILGNDLAGTVVQVGAKVTRFIVGDEVYARPDDDRIGTFAELIAVRETALALKPKTLTMNDAASIPLVGLTAWQALVEKAQLKKGQKILIHAGSGGVGTFAIQLAKHLGATVATTTGTANVDWVKKLGADIVVNYKTTAFENVLHDYDVVLDTQGGKTLEQSLKVLKPGGKLISIAGAPDPQFAKDIHANWVVKIAAYLLSFSIRKKARRQNISYSFLFMKANGAQLGQITELIDQGVIRPVVDRVFAFESIAEALAYVEQGRAKGKVVVNLIKS